MKYLFCVKTCNILYIDHIKDFKTEEGINNFEFVLKESNRIIELLQVKMFEFSPDQIIYLEDGSNRVYFAERGCIYDDETKELTFIKAKSCLEFVVNQ